jgi:assimilatory nitrate reductase catalytic subunit
VSAAPAIQIDTTCPYCGVGCGVSATVDTQQQLAAVSGSSNHPANLGRLCVKGSALHETMGEHGRLLHPQINGCRTDWNTAIDVVAAGFSDIIKRHGPNAVSFYLSGQLLTEDYYVANKLMKGFIGSGNVDTNSRLCMASAVASYKRAFGTDAVPCCYEDLECCDLLIMVGSNAAWTHPVLYQRISAAKALRPQMKVVVLDPRRTASCEFADLHLALAPGSDGFIFSGLLRYLHDKGRTDSDYIDHHTEGFESALASTGCLDSTAAAAGIDAAELEEFYRWFARTEKTITFYSQGVNQSATGTDKCNAIINCHLATGRIGKRGMGPFSITGQPNAMGGREVGGLANQLAAHMDFNPDNVERLARFWDSDTVAAQPGLKAVELFNALERGEIKAIWIMATNPVVSLPDSNRISAALKNCELVVVSDCIEKTDTTQYAHVLLPAAGWGEKDGTVTNSERCISRQRALMPPLGEARADWWIISAVARKMGFVQQFDYPNAASVFREHARLSGFENDAEGQQRLFNINPLATITDDQYLNLTPIQWPITEQAGRLSGTDRLFSDNKFYTPSGKARFVTVQAELPQRNTTLPWVINTGRIRDQWHTMTRTARSPRLLNHIDAPFVALHPGDASALGIQTGDLLRLHNTQGAVVLQAVLDAGQRPGEVYAPVHWNDQYASDGRISKLIPSVVDPHSGQPQSKYAELALQKIPVLCWLQVISRDPLDVSEFDYWVKIPVAGGCRYILAIAGPATVDNSLQLIKNWLQKHTTALEKIEFTNTGTHDYRGLFCQGDIIQLAAFAGTDRDLLPDTQQLVQLLEHKIGTDSWKLLNGSRDKSASGRLICSCHQVSERSIVAAINEGAITCTELGRKLRCGTNCGSCIPELEQLLRTANSAVAATIDTDPTPC